MSHRDLSPEAARAIELSATGDVVVERSASELIRLDGDTSDECLTVEQTPDLIRLRVTGDLRLAVPEGLSVTVRSWGGDARITGLRAGVTVGEARGDLRLADLAGEVQFDTVHGDLTAERVHGTLRGQAVHGDLQVGQIAGPLSIAQVAGDARLDDCRGPVDLATVGGNLDARAVPAGLLANQVGGRLRLYTGFQPGSQFAITCGGSARIRVWGEPDQVSLSCDLRSLAGRFQIELPLTDLVREGDTVRGRLGAGEAALRVQSGGNLRLGARDGEPAVEELVTTIFDDLGSEITSSISSSFSSFADVASRGPQWREKAEKLARRAQEEAQREADRARRHADRLTRQASPRAWGWGWAGGPPRESTPGPARPPQPPPPPRPPGRPRATDEERMLVLRMLSEGKIKPEEAARLLDALGT